MEIPLKQPCTLEVVAFCSNQMQYIRHQNVEMSAHHRNLFFLLSLVYMEVIIYIISLIKLFIEDTFLKLS